MQKKARGFFLLLMAIFLLGVLTHLFIPLEIVVMGTRKIEQAYNGYKIEVEQNMVRSLAFLNAKVIANEIQTYENIRSSYIKLFETGSRYETINPQFVHLNSAHQLANMDQAQLAGTDMGASMWYIAGVSNIQQMNEVQLWITFEYMQLEQYIDSMTVDLASGDSILLAIEIFIGYEGQQIYFEHPSSARQIFKSPDYDVFGEFYQDTIKNYMLNKRVQTMYNNAEALRSCSIILDAGSPFAVVCLKMDVQRLTQTITNTLKIPNFTLSTTQYLVVRPLYRYDKVEEYPQIISYFQSDNLSIDTPTDRYFTDLGLELSKTLFNASYMNYLMNVQQLQIQEQTKTYYVLPIETYNNLDTTEVCLYLIVVNNFQRSELDTQSKTRQLFVSMIIPSALLFLVSALAMGFIMKPIFVRLNQSITLMGEYCHYIKRNDLSLEVVEHGQTADILTIFQELKYLNMLNKLATPAYLKVSYNERIIKLFQALQLFSELNYCKANIYENLAECFSQTNQPQNAIKYIKLAVESAVDKVGGMDKLMLEGSDPRSERSRLNQRKQSQLIRSLHAKIFKLSMLLYQQFKPGDNSTLTELARNTALLRQLSYRHPYTAEYVLGFMVETICRLENEQDLPYIENRINKAAEMVKVLQQTKSAHKFIDPAIMKAYWHYLRGKYLMRVGQDLQAYEQLVIGLDGETFDPTLHGKIKEELLKIAKTNGLCRTEIEQVFEYLKLEPSEQSREFIFVCDVSNPNLSLQQFSEWKTKARKMVETIFHSYIHKMDRIGINQFCVDLKVVCNLIEKGSSENMLRKELLASVKARDQKIFSQLITNIGRVIDRTKNLKRHKVFIFVLKEGAQVQTDDVVNEIASSDNSTFIFLVQNGTQKISHPAQQFYIVGFDDYDDLQIILGRKTIIKADNIIHLF